jgi:hypothetical protein
MTAIKKDQHVDLLNDHYKDTFTHLSEYRRLRDRLFALILLTITIMLFQLYSPDEAGRAIGEFVVSKLDLQTLIGISFIESIIWFILLSLVIRYFQTVILIERQYDYLHRLEEEINKNFGGVAFTREGKSYLKNYPLFSKWTHMLYTIVSPALLILVIMVKISHEIYFASGTTPLLIFDIAIAIFTLISTILYLVSIYHQSH